MLSICLWKEWREHRATFFWLLGIALSVQMLLTAVLPEFWVGPGFVRYSILGWSAIAVLLFSTALVQTEYRTEHDAFPCRLPLGERSRFYSKVLLLVILVSVTLLLQGLILASILWLRGVSSAVGIVESLHLLPVLLSAGLLLMATAWWLPRSALVHPFAMLLLGIVTLPFSVSFIQRSWVIPSEGETFFLLGVLLPLLSLLVARLSSLGMKDSVQRAFCLGGGAFVCSLFGISVLGAVRIDDWDRFDPLAADASITSALVGKGGRLAYVNASRGNVPRGYALIVDLETGAWEQVDGSVTEFKSAAFHDRGNPWSWNLAGRHAVVFESRSDGRLIYRDGQDARILSRGFRRLVDQTTIVRLRASQAGVAWLRTKDYEKAWFLEGVEIGSAASPRVLPWKAGIVPYWPLGCAGFRVLDATDGNQRYFDLHREAVFSHPDTNVRGPVLRSPGSRARRLSAITPAGWILVDRDWYKASEKRRLFLHDPVTGADRMLDEFPPLTHIVENATLPDGRLVMLQPGQGRLEKHILIYDPATGQRASPTLDRQIIGRCLGAVSSSGRTVPVWTSVGECLFWVRLNTSRGYVKHLLALSPDTLELRVIVLSDLTTWRVLDASEESTVILLDMGAGEIRRYSWGRDEGELLFPKPVGKAAPGRFER